MYVGDLLPVCVELFLLLCVFWTRRVCWCACVGVSVCVGVCVVVCFCVFVGVCVSLFCLWACLFVCLGVCWFDLFAVVCFVKLSRICRTGWRRSWAPSR